MLSVMDSDSENFTGESKFTPKVPLPSGLTREELAAQRLANLTQRGLGRPKGVKNKATIQAREIAQSLTTGDPEYLERLRQRVRSGRCPPAIEQMLWAYAHGRPVERIEVTGAVQHNHDVLAIALRELPLEQLQAYRAANAAIEAKMRELQAGTSSEVIDAEVTERPVEKEQEP
jgi:hypothetical protein